MTIRTKFNEPLSKILRAQLENTIKAARDTAEKGAYIALAQMAVAEARTPEYLTDELRALRRRLRAHGRALGDIKASDNTQGVQHLVWETAYEHWHRMLFARFLAENGLLLWEPGAAVSLEDCEGLVQETDPAMNLGAKSKWELAATLAARMLPQVFKPLSPVFELNFAPEHQREMEQLLAALPVEVFQASDSLGWVYQFWQAKRKDAVNASEIKIGADELSAVTQLFTEPYMVDFLLHNSLGAWWLTRHPDKLCPVPLTYVRMLANGTPAAGKFEHWPEQLRDFTLLDPCCGSGHFLVAAFLMLVPMRVKADGLSAADAVDAVLRENLHGLELDARCVEIAVFALALTAWRYPDESGNALGVRSEMPAPQVACCGLKVAAKPEDWAALVPEHVANSEHLREGLRRLHSDFSQAPLLGSLLDPSKASGDLFAADFKLLTGLLEDALRAEHQPALWDDVTEVWDNAVTARGLLDAARILDARYNLVVTNVPYLARGRQSEVLKNYCESHYPDAKNDLANVFLERCLELSSTSENGSGAGVVQIVMPQNWLFLSSYRKQRESLLKRVRWNLLARLGPGAFETISGEVVQVVLLTQTQVPGAEDFELRGVDASAPKSAFEKALLLQEGPVVSVNQMEQLENPEATIALRSIFRGERLSAYAGSYKGLGTGDDNRFKAAFWEVDDFSKWIPMASAPAKTSAKCGGYSDVLYWEGGAGALAFSPTAYLRNTDKWNQRGILFGMMGDVPCVQYRGGPWDTSSCVVIPAKKEYLSAIWAFAESQEFRSELRANVAKVSVEVAHFGQVPFDLKHWQQVALTRYPDGLPKAQSDDPTQWLFHGHPQSAVDPLLVAVARLAGYHWPAERDASIELADEARSWIERCEPLAEHIDDDGILCLPSVRGEKPAHERMIKLLIAAWETVQPGSWKPAVLDKLLHDVGCGGKSLEFWLRDRFFEQHAKRFHHRPFIWHVWDGLNDGFSALVNYHKLDRKNLERLIHTYLGDWIRQQEAGVRASSDGSFTRLAAAQDLKRRLELILEGEAPYDVFVRWKSVTEQPLGWNPDLNDGVRLNIRPFITAEVLRHNKKPKLNINWDKDRGRDLETAPWFDVFKGERINNHHLSLAEKNATTQAKVV